MPITSESDKVLLNNGFVRPSDFVLMALLFMTGVVFVCWLAFSAAPTVLGALIFVAVGQALFNLWILSVTYRACSYALAGRLIADTLPAEAARLVVPMLKASLTPGMAPGVPIDNLPKGQSATQSKVDQATRGTTGTGRG